MQLDIMNEDIPFLFGQIVLHKYMTAVLNARDVFERRILGCKAPAVRKKRTYLS